MEIDEESNQKYRQETFDDKHYYSNPKNLKSYFLQRKQQINDVNVYETTETKQNSSDEKNNSISEFQKHVQFKRKWNEGNDGDLYENSNMKSQSNLKRMK